MKYKAKFYDIKVGTNHFMNTPCALGVEEEDGSIHPIIIAKVRESDNVFLFSFDGETKSGIPIHVRNNKPIDKNPNFEIKHLANEKIVIETEIDGVVLEIRNANQHDWGSVEVTGDFIFKGTPIEVTENSLKVRGGTLTGNTVKNCGGILITSDGVSLGFKGEIPDFESKE